MSERGGMSERERFEEWRGWVPDRHPDGRYYVCTVDDELKAWQARARIAEQREAEMLEAIEHAIEFDLGWSKRADNPGFVAIREKLKKAVAEHEQEKS